MRPLYVTVTVLLSMFIGTTVGLLAEMAVPPSGSLLHRLVTTGYCLTASPENLDLGFIFLSGRVGMRANLFSLVGIVLGGFFSYRQVFSRR